MAGPPRRGARAGHGCDRAVPGREDLDRAADRGRLLLRLRVPTRREALRCRLRAHRGADARAREGRRALRAQRAARGRRDRAVPLGGAGLQGRADRGPGARPGRGDRVALPQRPVHRPVPRPARADHQEHQGVQAHQRRGGLLARRRLAPDAHARLRHRLPLGRRPGGAPGAARAGATARPPQAGARARPVHVHRAVAGRAAVEAGRDRDLEPAHGPVAARERRARLPRGAHPHPLGCRAVEALGPLGRVPRQHVLRRRGGPDHGAQAHELPGPHPDLRLRAALLPRPAHPHVRGRAGSPPRAQRHAARAPARAPHHPGRRPHLLHRGADPRGGAALPGLRLLDLRHVRLRAAPGAVHAPGEARGRGGDVGPRRGRAGAGARVRPASTTTSTRATAPSTGPRSTCT